jgi:hypothetical protein
MPNLGGFKALGQLAQGIIALPEIAYSALPGGPKSQLPQVGKGLVAGLGGVASTLASPIGIPGKWNLGENVIEPGVEALTGKDSVKDFWQMSKENGPLYGAINTVLNALPVTGPLAGVAGAAADVADTAALTAEASAAAEGATAASVGEAAAADALTKTEMIGNKGLGVHPFKGFGADSGLASVKNLEVTGSAEDYAASVQKMADALRTKATIYHAIAHPVGGLFHGISEQAAASFAKLNPFETTSPEPVPGAADLIPQADKDAAIAATKATAAQSEFEAGGLYEGDSEPMESALRALQAPEKAASEVMSKTEHAGIRTPSTFDETTGEATNITKEEKAATREEIAGHVEEAKANIEQPGTGEGSKLGEIEKRISQPAAAWAVRMAERLPDSVNQVLAQMKGTIDKFHLNQAARSLEQWVEVQQRQVQHGAAVTTSVMAGMALKDAVRAAGGKITDFQASQAIGEELNAMMRGNKWVSEMLRTDGDPALVQAMRAAARRGYPGLEPWLKYMDEPQLAEVMRHLHDAQEIWTTEMQKRMQVLLASRPGAKGLEAAVLGLDQPPMSASQLKEYRKAKLFLRMKAKLEARISDDPIKADPRYRDLNRLDLATEKAANEAQALRERSGILQRNMEDLRTAPPKASLPEHVSRLAAELRDQLDDQNPDATGGITFDPGSAKVGFSDGATQVVGLAEQATYDVDFLRKPGEAEKAILEAVTKPVNATGGALPPGIWGNNLKIGFWNDNGTVYVDISADTHYDGTPFTPLEADLLGMAHGQLAVFDARDFTSRALSQASSDQNLWAHYIADLMDRKSNLSKFLAEQASIEQGSSILTEGDSTRALTVFATWDYSLARSNPAEHAIGDIWSRLSYDESGRIVPNDEQLLHQTVLRMLPGTEADAIEGMDVDNLHKALKWYYDSHEYIEGKYRGKQIQLLNGEWRDAADVFYDLIAVTSVQASPTQNFGRALVGLANWDDFLQGRYTAMKSAQELMDHLEATPPGTVNIVGPYWTYGEGATVNPATGEVERIAGPGDTKYTKLSRRFMSDEVRNLTSGTNMTNDAKYKVMDVMRGDLKLESSKAGDIQHNAEWWSSNKGASAESMDRLQVVKELDRNNVHTPASEAYRQWVVERNRVKVIADEMSAANRDPLMRQTPGQTFASHPEWVQEFGTKAGFDRYRKGVLADEEAFLTDAEINDAHDQALMEHQGSSLLAKLRSFRDNLANPHTSLAVTLDSVMGRLWGFNSQQWDKVGFYAKYADKIRDIAAELSKRWGYDVKPHEVQAALWVHAKLEIGRQDWGRLLAHHDVAMNQIDAWEQGAPIEPRIVQGHLKPVQPEDLLADYKKEEIGYSEAAQVTRSDRKYLLDKKNADRLSPAQEEQAAQMRIDFEDYKDLNNQVARGDITPADTNQWAEYESLRQKVGEGQTTDVTTAPNRENIREGATEPTRQETRYEIAYDANKLKAQKVRFGGYDAVVAQLKDALDARDFQKARELVTAWVISQRDSVMGQGGSSFGVTAEGQLIKDELARPGDLRNATAEGTERLQNAKTIPAPNDMSRSRFRIEALHELLRNGQISQEQFDVRAAQFERSLSNEEPGLNQLGPADTPHPDPGMTRVYRGSDYPEPVGMQGMWWTDHQPYGRGGYEHWQQTDMPSDTVERLKAQVLSDRDRLDPAGTPVVGRDLMLDPNEPAHASAMDRAVRYMHDAVNRGDVDALHQSFEHEVRGALLDHPTPDGHLVMRMFKNAAFDTIMHEGAHLLRRILPSDMLKALEEKYPHILDEDVAAGLGENTKANPLRVAAEEKFVADLMVWIRNKTHGNWAAGGLSGELPEQAGAGAGTLVGEALARTVSMENVYGQIAAVIEDNVLQTVGSPVGPQQLDVNAFWTRLFFPEIDKPDVIHDPISSASLEQGRELRKFRYETDTQYARRVRQYGEARQALKQTQLLADKAERRAVQAETAAKKMHVLITNTPSDLQKRATELGVKADKILDRLARQLESPDPSKVPMQWRSLWEGVVDMQEQAKADPTGRLAEIMADVPQTFQDVLREAAQRGFDPQFLPDMTWEMANRSLFGHIRIAADTELLDSTRKANRGVLHNSGIANQSIEQLGAGLIAATKELYSNTLVTHIEDYYAKPLAPGAAIPKGWVPWSPEREYIMTGTRPSGEIAATGGNMIVPEHVARALDSMSKRYDHWTFHTLTKANSVWRTWQLTLSPRYYIHIFVANMVRAMMAGAMPKDFLETIKGWKAGTLPDELIGLDQVSAYRQLTGEDMPNRAMPSVFAQGPDRLLDRSHFAENNAEAEGKVDKVKAAIHSAKQSLEKAHANIDMFARSVVFESKLRTGASREAALAASLEALGDYGSLSPFERAVTRAVMPFYPYYKGLVKLLMRMPADHPGAAVALMQAGKIHQEYMEDLLNGPVPQSLDSTFNIFGFHQMTILDPFINAVHAVEPLNLATSLSPFVSLLMRTAYNAPTKGTSVQGPGPTGKRQANYDPLRGALQLAEGAPPVLAAQGALGTDNAYNQNPGLQTAIAKYVGVPQPTAVADVQAQLHPTPTQQIEQKATKKAAAEAKRKAKKLAAGPSLKPKKAHAGNAKGRRIATHFTRKAARRKKPF